MDTSASIRGGAVGVKVTAAKHISTVLDSPMLRVVSNANVLYTHNVFGFELEDSTLMDARKDRAWSTRGSFWGMTGGERNTNHYHSP